MSPLLEIGFRKICVWLTALTPIINPVSFISRLCVAQTFYLLRRRRCFEIAKPRRSAGGAQLNRSLGELEGPIRDPVLARFPKVAAFSSAESGSGEPPDRAQICAMMSEAVSNFFFLSRFLDLRDGATFEKTQKNTANNRSAPVMWPRT